MGLTQSISVQVDGDEEEEEEEEDEEENVKSPKNESIEITKKKLPLLRNKELLRLNHLDELEQDPEIVPFESSASPASSVNTPHRAPSVRVWDPGNILSPLGAISHHSRSFNGRMHVLSSGIGEDEVCTEIYIIRAAENSMNAVPGMISGRSPCSVVTPEGRRQARALGVFLLSHGVHFDSVFSSPLERCKQTTVAVCQEVNFAEEQIEYSDALVELSQGLWDGFRITDVYTTESLNMMINLQHDFRAPGGESQRQVELRMVEFINNVVLQRSVEASLEKDSKFYKGKNNLLMQVHPLNEISSDAKNFETLTQHSVMYMKGSGKSRLHVSSTDTSTQTEQRSVANSAHYQVAIFSHGMAIRCLLRGILGSNPHMTSRLSIDNTSMTVLRHSTLNGWQIIRVNDTAHLRLL